MPAKVSDEPYSRGNGPAHLDEAQLDYVQLGAVVTAQELAAAAYGTQRAVPADRQIVQAVLMPQLVDPVADDGIEVLLNVLVVAHRQTGSAHASLGPMGPKGGPSLLGDGA